jgi:hypothetical protein
MEKKTGIELIAQERAEQIEKHGRTVEQDAELNRSGQLMYAAKQLITERVIGFNTPNNWDFDIFSKMICKPYKERLIIAAALIAAEIDRLQSL